MKCADCQTNMVFKKGEIDLRVKGKLYLGNVKSFMVVAGFSLRK